MLRYTFGSSKRTQGIYSNEKNDKFASGTKVQGQEKKRKKKLSSSESQHLQIGQKERQTWPEPAEKSGKYYAIQSEKEGVSKKNGMVSCAECCCKVENPA